MSRTSSTTPSAPNPSPMMDERSLRSLNVSNAVERAKTSEAELNSLVAHCVRHNKKATTSNTEGEGGGGGSGGGGKSGSTSGGRILDVALGEDSIPEELKDVLRRLTRETFSDNTIMITIEKVRHVGAYGGIRGEARHNSQMMVVSKLINDLVTRQRAGLGFIGGALGGVDEK